MKRKYVPFRYWKEEHQALAFVVFFGVIFVGMVTLMVYMKSAGELKP